MITTTNKYRVKKFLNDALRKAFFDKIAKYYSLDIGLQIQKKALEATVEYVEEHMNGAYTFTNNLSLLKWAVSQAQPDGLFMEFGVWQGATVNFIAEQVPANTVHGFDSFQGLPEFWVEITHVGRYDKGAFDMFGKLPDVRQNVILHPGWFEKSLPIFVESYQGEVSFLHVDCDLYSSAKTIFDNLGDRIKSGTVIVFDEYFNYPTWQKHEHKAFQEFITERNIKYKYIAYNRVGREVAVMIE
jgi:Macrocin-O-methyltransferase (TylF)